MLSSTAGRCGVAVTAVSACLSIRQAACGSKCEHTSAYVRLASTAGTCGGAVTACHSHGVRAGGAVSHCQCQRSSRTLILSASTSSVRQYQAHVRQYHEPSLQTEDSNMTRPACTFASLYTTICILSTQNAVSTACKQARERVQVLPHRLASSREFSSSQSHYTIAPAPETDSLPLVPQGLIH